MLPTEFLVLNCENQAIDTKAVTLTSDKFITIKKSNTLKNVFVINCDRVEFKL